MRTTANTPAKTPKGSTAALWSLVDGAIKSAFEAERRSLKTAYSALFRSSFRRIEELTHALADSLAHHVNTGMAAHEARLSELMKTAVVVKVESDVNSLRDTMRHLLAALEEFGK